MLVATLAVLGAVHLVRNLLPVDADAQLLAQLAFVPGRFTELVDPSRVMAGLQGLDGADPQLQDRLQAAQFFLEAGDRQVWTVLTYALLHANWTHLGFNAVWLLAFGAPVARRFGNARFLLFLVAGALGGAATHYVLFPLSFEPLVGASAAVSACMGAAVRFMFQPVDRTEHEDGRAPHRPRLALSGLGTNRRALGFLLAWFVTNALSGIGPVATGLAGGPIAWQAHIGGFLLGLLGFALFDPADRPAASGPPPRSADPADPA